MTTCAYQEHDAIAAAGCHPAVGSVAYYARIEAAIAREFAQQLSNFEESAASAMSDPKVGAILLYLQ